MPAVSAAYEMVAKLRHEEKEVLWLAN